MNTRHGLGFRGSAGKAEPPGACPGSISKPTPRHNISSQFLNLQAHRRRHQKSMRCCVYGQSWQQHRHHHRLVIIETIMNITIPQVWAIIVISSPSSVSSYSPYFHHNRHVHGIHRLTSAYTIIHHHTSSYNIMHHPASSYTVVHHHTPSIIFASVVVPPPRPLRGSWQCTICRSASQLGLSFLARWELVKEGCFRLNIVCQNHNVVFRCRVSIAAVLVGHRPFTNASNSHGSVRTSLATSPVGVIKVPKCSETLQVNSQSRPVSLKRQMATQ